MANGFTIHVRKCELIHVEKNSKINWKELKGIDHKKHLGVIMSAECIYMVITAICALTALTRRDANMNQPTENRPTLNTGNSNLHISHLPQKINTVARLVRAHLDFCTSWGQTQ